MHHAHARQVAMHLIRKSTPLSLPRIGVIFGRDHTTVLHAVRVVSTNTEMQKVAAEIAAAAQSSLVEQGSANDGQ
jgi:chromosomal replication initiation ATPase DnaA